MKQGLAWHIVKKDNKQVLGYGVEWDVTKGSKEYSRLHRMAHGYNSEDTEILIQDFVVAHEYCVEFDSILNILHKIARGQEVRKDTMYYEVAQRLYRRFNSAFEATCVTIGDVATEYNINKYISSEAFENDLDTTVAIIERLRKSNKDTLTGTEDGIKLKLSEEWLEAYRKVLKGFGYDLEVDKDSKEIAQINSYSKNKVDKGTLLYALEPMILQIL